MITPSAGRVNIVPLRTGHSTDRRGITIKKTLRRIRAESGTEHDYWLVMGIHIRGHITPVLASLHWLPLHF